MKILMIAANAPHLKTEQVVEKMVLRGITTITIGATPWKQRKARNINFQHRPNQSESPSLKLLAQSFGLNFLEIDDWMQCNYHDYDFIVMTGGVLVPEEVIEFGVPVINCHPGIIPNVRGLDAFKWAIYDMVPMGNTLHFIDGAVDIGQPIKIIETPVFSTDSSIEILARRHYEYEINLLSYFDLFLDGDRSRYDFTSQRPAHMRMKREDEDIMMSRFPSYVEKYGVS